MKNILIREVFEPIEKAGFKVWFVGGCVRDQLMGVAPHDFDICTNAKPADLHKIFTKFSNVSENSEPFGVTIILVPQNDKMMEVEIATLRKDITKGRHPKIEFTDSVKEDAMRRDFTVNALFETSKGEIIDPTGFGVVDCENKTLRFVGDPQERISEDPLRIFRFVRFLASKGFSSAHDIHDTLNWKADFEDVSKERILKELEKTFAGKFLFTGTPRPWDFFLSTRVAHRIGMAGLMVDMVNETQSLKWHAEGSTWQSADGVTKPAELLITFKGFQPVANGNVLDHVLRVMENMSKLTADSDEHKRFIMMMAAFLHDIGKTKPEGEKTSTWIHDGQEVSETIPVVHNHDVVGAPMALEFCKKLGMSNDDSEFVSELTRMHMRMHQLTKIKSRFAMLKLTNHPFFNDIVTLAKADESACIKTVDDEWIGVEQALKVPLASECVGVPMPKPLVTGDDLIAAGRKPGPEFKKLLEIGMKLQIDQNQKKESILKQLKNMKF